MKLGAMGTSLAADRSPEGMQPEVLLAAAHDLGLQVVSMRSTGWEEPGWSFLFQFTAGKVGHELADGAEVYGLIHADGRGRFIVHSH